MPPRSLLPAPLTRWNAGHVAVGVGLVSFAAVTYLVVVVMLGSVLGLPTDPPSTVLAVVATSVVALGLPRVRRWLRRVAAGGPGDDGLVRITHELSGAMPADDLLPRMARMLGEATSAGAVEIRVRYSGKDAVVGRWPANAPIIEDHVRGLLVRPILLHATQIGELLLRPRLTRSGRPRRLRQAEDRLLDAFVGRAGLAVESVQLRDALSREVVDATRRAGEVRASRHRLVEAADAERHRIERNIHDGAQQHLVALS